MDSRYNNYRNYIKQLVDSRDLTNFKNSMDGEYNIIVEHKDSKWGEDFYRLIKAEFNISDDIISDFCKKNDSIGNPQKIQHSFGSCSVNSIKYIYHANLILDHFKSLSLSNIRVVEIGGGYGGLALALEYFSQNYNLSITEYNIIDLDEAIKLQELYLKIQLGDISKYRFHNAANYGELIPAGNLYLIGIYSIGEFLKEIQDEYINKLFPKVDHGFIIWNEKPKHIPKLLIREPERPLTGPFNHFIYF